MDYLDRLIAGGDLRISCPSCKKLDRQKVDEQQKLLHCNICHEINLLTSWVTFIRRIGDGDPYVHLTIEALDGEGYKIKVDTARRDMSTVESICFAGSGGRSYSLLSCLHQVLEVSDPGKRVGKSVQFLGIDGVLLLREERNLDIWTKTTDITHHDHGKEVVFSKTSQFSVHVPQIVEAMLNDSVRRPISFPE